MPPPFRPAEGGPVSVPTAVPAPAPATPPVSLPLRELSGEELPREKFDRLGPGSLADAELLALFFGTGTKGLNVIEMSRRLLGQFGSLHDLSRLNWQQFMEVPGIGEAKAKHLGAAFELGKRLARQTYATLALDDPEKIAEFIGPELRAQSREVIRIILLNTKLRLQRMEEVALGSVNECTARIAELLRPAVIHNAHAFILAHNHPSGDPTPSSADRHLTHKLKEASTLLGLHFTDHIIIGLPGGPGRPGYFSFRQIGLL